MPITILTESEIRQCVKLDAEAVAAVEGAFTALAEGRAMTPPIVHVEVTDHRGEVDIKTAYIQGLDSFAIKVASGFYENYKLGLPSGSGLMLLWSARNGFPEAVLLDNGYLTDVRTAAAGAIAAKYLARKAIRTVGVIGAGVQGRYQAAALRLVRTFERVVVYDNAPDRLAAYIQEMEAELGIPVEAARGPEEVVRRSDVVITATPSTIPFVRAEWLHPGLHITAMGSDNIYKQELYPDVLACADVRVCDLKSQVFRLGEHHHALEAGTITEGDDLIELGEITSGRREGRTSDAQITICDLTGTGVQDTAIALLAHRKAVGQGMGSRVGG